MELRIAGFPPQRRPWMYVLFRAGVIKYAEDPKPSCQSHNSASALITRHGDDLSSLLGQHCLNSVSSGVRQLTWRAEYTSNRELETAQFERVLCPNESATSAVRREILRAARPAKRVTSFVRVTCTAASSLFRERSTARSIRLRSVDSRHLTRAWAEEML